MMKSLFSLFKKLSTKDYLFVIILLGLSYYTWHLMINMVIQSQSFCYLIKPFAACGPRILFTSYGTSSFLLGPVLSKLFSVNMSQYWFIYLWVIIFTNILFYFLVKALVKDKFLSFFSAVVFAFSYFGTWDMYIASYGHFIERVINVPFLMVSLIFLHLFLKKSKIKYYLLSTFLFFFTVGFNHFNVMFTAPYLFYPFFWYLFNHKNKKDILKGMLLGLAYLVISGFFVILQLITEPTVHSSQWTFLQFLLHPQTYQYPEKILRQLVYWSQYPTLIRHLGEFNPVQYIMDPKGFFGMVYPITAAYVISAIVIYRRLPRFRSLLFMVIFATLTTFYLNAYFNQYIVLEQPGSNRYLYFPTILLSIFWTLFLLAVFEKTRKLMVIFGILILSLYYYINTSLILDNFKTQFISDKGIKKIYESIIKIRPRLEENTLVVASYPEIDNLAAQFFDEQLGRGEVKYLPDTDRYKELPTWQSIASVSAHVVKLIYDSKCQCVTEEKIK